MWKETSEHQTPPTDGPWPNAGGVYRKVGIEVRSFDGRADLHGDQIKRREGKGIWTQACFAACDADANKSNGKGRRKDAGGDGKARRANDLGHWQVRCAVLLRAGRSAARPTARPHPKPTRESSAKEVHSELERDGAPKGPPDPMFE